MKKMIGLLLLIGPLGCELHRPYCGRCLLAREEMGYRPKTVVTMRADTLPETTPSAEGPSNVQLASASTVSGSSIGGAATPTGPIPTVTVTIPAMKIVLPVTTTTINKTPVSGTPAIGQLPPASGPNVPANSTEPSSVRAASSPSVKETRPVASHAVPEPSSPVASPVPHLEPVPELRSADGSESPKKKGVDPLRPSKLSLLPLHDPPEVPAKPSTSAAEAAFEVPPPPPVPPRRSSDGSSLPPVDPEHR
jgi:hypothetical protein